MTDGVPPHDGDPHENDQEKPKPGQPVKLTGKLVRHERFSARDGDFDGANDEAMAIRLATFEEEHRDLDAAITSLELNSPYERLTIARLKKKKLQLKDTIKEIKDSMLPDIIA